MLVRAEKNHWWAAGVLVLVGNVLPPILWLRTDPAIMWPATIVIAIALFFVIRRLTITRKWWVLPLLGSPFVVGPLLIGVAFVLAIMGVIPVP